MPCVINQQYPLPFYYLASFDVMSPMMTNFAPISITNKQQVLAELCEQFDDAIFILDEHLRYLSVNARYELMIGYTEAFLLGRPLGIYAAEFLSEEERVVLTDITERLDNRGFYENN